MLIRNFAFWTASIWLLTMVCPLASGIQVEETTEVEDALENAERRRERWVDLLQLL